MKDTIQNICEENEWILAIFYSPMNLRKDNYCTSNNMPYFQKDMNDENITAFREFGDKRKFKMDEGNVGRVWKSQHYEWQNNVQTLPSDVYPRKYYAVDAVIRCSLTMAVVENKKLLGVVEFFL